MAIVKFEGGPLDGQLKQMASKSLSLLPEEALVRETDRDLTYWLDRDRLTYVFRGVRAWPGGPRPEFC